MCRHVLSQRNLQMLLRHVSDDACHPRRMILGKDPKILYLLVLEYSVLRTSSGLCPCHLVPSAWGRNERSLRCELVWRISASRDYSDSDRISLLQQE